MWFRLLMLCCCLSILPSAFAAQTYRLGPNDVLGITVLRHPEFSGDFSIQPDGWVAIPVVGKIQVTGKTIDEVTALVVTGLKTRLLKPEVTLSLKSSRVDRVYILGDVVKPGLLDYRPGWRVLEALAAAGGLLDNTLQADISVKHADGTTAAFDLGVLLKDAKMQAASALFPDDLVVVKKRYSRIAVLGFVNKPGYYDLQDGQPTHLTDAIGLAGGVDSKRGRLTEVAILRTSEGKQQRLVVNLENFLRKAKVDQNPDILAGDVVYVPETKKLDWGVIFQAVSSIGITGGLFK